MSSSAAVNNEQWVLTSRPNPLIAQSNFACVETEIPIESDVISSPEPQLLLQLTYVSVDPYLRGRMNEGKSYIEPFELNKPLDSFGIATVLAASSKAQEAGFNKGDIVKGAFPWKKFFVTTINPFLMKIDTQFGVPLTAYLGILGLTGLTAYFGLTDIAKMNSGETVFVTGAAGAVGYAVVQICLLHGMKVVGSTGTDAKVDLLRQMGCVAFNYKHGLLDDHLSELCPDGIDVYWDNVGGETLAITLSHMNTYGRIVCCGAISEYNIDVNDRYGVKNLFLIIKQQLKLEGFLMNKYFAQAGEAIPRLIEWYKTGKLTPIDTVVEGFAEIPSAFIQLFTGNNNGKMIVKI